MSTPAAAVTVERGQVLLLREPASDVLPERFKLWTVSAVRKTARGAAVKLLGWAPGCSMLATATFPDGLVREPWQVFELSQRDLATVFARHTAEPADAQA